MTKKRTRGKDKKKRKFPVRHRVKSHKREGKRVKSYERGKGTHPPRVRTIKRKINSSTTEPRVKGYVVNLTYEDGTGESLTLFGPPGMSGYQKIVDEAFEEKTDPRDPVEVQVLDPSLGEVLRVVGSGLKKAGHIGAKYMIRGGHIAKQTAIAAKPHLKKGIKAGVHYTKRGIRVSGKVAKITGRYAATSLASVAHDAIAKKLLQDAYSPDRVKRTIARVRLKKSFPDVYDIAHFSRT